MVVKLVLFSPRNASYNSTKKTRSDEGKPLLTVSRRSTTLDSVKTPQTAADLKRNMVENRLSCLNTAS